MATSGLASSLRRRQSALFDKAGAEKVVAFAIALGVALRVRLPLDVPLGVALSVVVLPVALGALLRYRGAFAIVSLTIIAALSGIILTAFSAGFASTDMRMLASNVVQVLGLGVVLVSLLWARSIVGSRAVVLAYGVGTLLSLAARGINFDNPWKFSFSVPVILIVLSLPWVYGKRWPQAIAITILCAVSVLNDSRSLSGMLLIALLLTLTQGSERRAPRGARVALVFGRMALIAIAGYLLAQAAILEGLLGELAQSRTESQISASGSALAGGRPEMGAAVALIVSRPAGFGAGTLPSGADVLTAQSGMNELGYNPNNGYVTNYMFGAGFEVHSVIGDLWLRFGLGGLALALAILILSVWGLSRSLASGLASTVMVFVVIRLLWDLAFSPFDSALLTLPLALALVLPRKTGPAPLGSVGLQNFGRPPLRA